MLHCELCKAVGIVLSQMWNVPPSNNDLESKVPPHIAKYAEATGCFFTGSAPKSVEDGKIPTKKVKVDLSQTARCEVLTLTFTFLVGILPSSTLRTFRGGTS